MQLQSTTLPKHIQVLEYLLAALMRGEYRVGDRLPVDTELARAFGASRPTVAKALAELQARGLVERKVGSGTYVLKAPAGNVSTELLGVLIPDTGRTEILDAIVRHMTREVQRLEHGLLLGDLGQFSLAGQDADEKARSAESAASRLVAQGVSGVFFAPVEFTSDGGRANQKVLTTLRQAGVPVVLIDRDVGEFDKRSALDLVSIDHVRAAFLLTRHLVELGRRRIAFLALENSAGSSLLRRAGVREALAQSSLEFGLDWARYGNPADKDFVRRFMHEVRPDALVCSNDETAAQLMLTLEGLSLSVPRDVSVVGIDNVNYGEFLRVPLTTVAQPCEAIGQLAVRMLLERIREPTLATRTITLEPRLVVRASCGARAS